ncbi:hypothetical protein WJ95_20600 [Burkholderia ubonensis]|uniref:gp53-like domain-containing protein n=1 Tax=Burkholderia ubonensis TaxID=101571 RepID=UPI00075EF00F|nr:hypothetical protein [Burkholderia ubonensis]KVP84562.1 hypothetical protein WJ95_20600 [Burkholderia ubonensis]
MATNDFLPFGGGGAANVIDQSTYAALAARLTGFQSGTAQSPQLNKVWRQSSIMAAVLAQFIVDQTGQSAVDDGTTATLEANLKAAINAAGVTAPQFDNSTKLATTAFVQRALGNMQSGVRIQSAGSAAFSASQAGGSFTLEVSSTTYTLPALSAVQPGATFEFLATVNAATVATAGADKMMTGSLVSSSTCVLNNGDTAKFVSDGAYWVLVSGSAALRLSLGDFGNSLSTNGYQKLPSGLIIQWGVVSVPANTTYTYNFPIAYRAACYSLVGTRGAPGSNASFNFSPISGTQFQTQNYGTGTEVASWIALGY